MTSKTDRLSLQTPLLLGDDRPWARHLAHLDTDDSVKDCLGNFAKPFGARRDGDVAALEADAAGGQKEASAAVELMVQGPDSLLNRRDKRGRARAEHLNEVAVLLGVLNLLHADLALDHIYVPRQARELDVSLGMLAQERQDRVTNDTREDNVLKRGCDNLKLALSSFENDKDVL